MRPPSRPANLETPGLKWRPRKGGWAGYWICRADLAEAGFPVKTRLLHAGATPTADEWLGLQTECARLQYAMLTWRQAARHEAKSIYDGSWRSLIDVYLSDPDSPFQRLRFSTARTYRSRCDTLAAVLGGVMTADTTFREFKRWGIEFKKGGKVARSHGLMTQIRLIVNFGVLCELAECARLDGLLAKMEFEMPKRRQVFITAAQSIAIRREAHRLGFPSIALAQALQFELGVRQKDVVGEWLPRHMPGLSDVIQRGEKWLMGFRWSEVDERMVLRHRLSKSVRGADAVGQADAGKVEEFPLLAYPMVVEEIDRVPAEKRVGPMIVAEHTGVPWRQKYFAEKWRECARAAGVPDGAQNRDNRAGAGTEGRKSGATLEDMRHFLGHSKIDTTAIYDRTDVDDRTKVAQLRAERRRNDGGER